MARRTFISRTPQNNVVMATCSLACYDNTQNQSGQLPQSPYFEIGNLGPSPGLVGALGAAAGEIDVDISGTITTDASPITFNVGAMIGYGAGNGFTNIGSTGTFTPDANLSAVRVTLRGKINMEAIYPQSVTATFSFNGDLIVETTTPKVYPIRNTGTSITVPLQYGYAKCWTQPGASSSTNYISWENWVFRSNSGPF